MNYTLFVLSADQQVSCLEFLNCVLSKHQWQITAYLSLSHTPTVSSSCGINCCSFPPVWMSTNLQADALVRHPVAEKKVKALNVYLLEHFRTNTAV